MSDDDVVSEIVRQLPVKEFYQDAVSPAAKEAGELARDILKAVRLATAPIQLIAGLQDRFKKFVEGLAWCIVEG